MVFMPFRVGVTTGLYTIAHDVTLASTVKKIGYALTRGANIIEISGDTPHEITYTEGAEIRNIARSQGLDLYFHGSLTIPMEMPERIEWRDAFDHMKKSIRSATAAGCKYVLFHACLHFWVELLTYTGTKLTITMCDHQGRFISEILHENKKLSEWFIKNMRKFGDMQYPSLILTEEELQRADYSAHAKWETEREESIKRGLEQLYEKEGLTKAREEYNRMPTPENAAKVNSIAARVEKLAVQVKEKISKEVGLNRADMARKNIDEEVRRKIAAGSFDVRKWKIMTYGRLLDAYKIMAHYLFYTKDPQWMSMVKVYKNVIDRYNIDYNDDDWLTNAWNEADLKNDIEFKQFFYAVVGAKYMEGHLKAIFDWLDNDYINGEIKGKKELQELARNLQITIEIPDSRDPKYAGRYILCHPKQIYSGVKTYKDVYGEKRIWMTFDFEHMATQGFDPWIEMQEMLRIIPNFGKIILSVHCAKPTPLHSHYPIELGDVDFYQLLWIVRQAGGGTGKGHMISLIFERGGGDDPFRQSVDALKLMAKYLDLGIDPDNLPPDFFGVKMTAFDEKRQVEIMMDHRFDVLKDLFEVPEEDWGILSSAAVKKGRKEISKKEELR